MSITALITGRLVADPARSTGPNGRLSTTALVAAAADRSEGLVSIIAFGAGAEQLAALAKGDSVSVTGKARVTTWTGKGGESRAGLSVTVHALLTAYHVLRNLQAVDGDEFDSLGLGQGGAVGAEGVDGGGAFPAESPGATVRAVAGTVHGKHRGGKS